MISGYGCKPVFQYKFRPLPSKGKVPSDGGFCILLYENGVLSFSVYDLAGAFMDEVCFALPNRVLTCFYSLLRNASSWLGSTPRDLRGPAEAHFASSFAFDGYEPIRVWGINSLLAAPTRSASGFFARHLYVLFEDICNLLAENGISLSLDGFTWNPDSVRPFRKNQLYSSGAQNVI